MMSPQGLADRKISIVKITWMIFITSTSVVVAQRRSRVKPKQNTLEVTYSELQNLRARCYPQDTCSVNREADNIAESFCQCGRICRKLDTCCLDSKYRNVTQNSKETPHACVPEYRNKAVLYFMIDRCKRGWSGATYFRDMCLGDAESLSDPLLLIPVTNTKQRRTYKNIYCAVCNDESKSELTFWKLHAFYEVEGVGLRMMSRLQLKDLRFNPRKHFKFKTSSFKVAEWELVGDDKNNVVRLQQDVPPSITKYVQRCRKMVSTCARNWKDDVVRKKCGSYMAHVVITDVPYTRYRNVHCAICNFRDLKNLKCLVINPADPGEVGKLPFSFGRLVDVSHDVSPTKGDLVVHGQQDKCKGNELFHPVKKVCIALSECLVGRVLKDGQCVWKTG